MSSYEIYLLFYGPLNLKKATEKQSNVLAKLCGWVKHIYNQ